MSNYPKCYKSDKANILFLAHFPSDSQLQRCIWFLDPDTRPIDEDEVELASENKAFECLEFVSDPVCIEINGLALRMGFGGDMADDAMLDDEIQNLMQGTIELGALSCQFAQVYECGISLYSWVENQAQMLIDTDWLDSELDAEYLPGAWNNLSDNLKSRLTYQITNGDENQSPQQAAWMALDILAKP